MPRRFREMMRGSFFGDYIYDQLVPRDHFLMQLNRVIDWRPITDKLIGYYQGKGERGEVPYEPAVILKMLLLAYLYNVSERQVEDLCTNYLPAKAFLGLGITEAAPDHSTLHLFRKRWLEQGKAESYGEVFDMIVRQAQAAGVEFGKLQIVDAVHTVADVNVEKDRKRKEQGKPLADPDATVVNKGQRQVTQADLSTQQQKVTHRGYKTHVSMDAETRIVTSIKPTMGNVADNQQMKDLVEHDRSMGVPGETYAGDRAYDDGDLHAMLKEKGKHSALKLRAFRFDKKDTNKEPWVEIDQDPLYHHGVGQRPQIESKFGEGKSAHHLGRCRYRGLDRFKVFSYLTFMVMNLKRIVLLVTGVRLRPLAKQLVAG